MSPDCLGASSGLQQPIRTVIFYPTPDIRHKTVDGLVVLLDLRAGEYVIFDRVATAMWQVLLSATEHREQVAALERQFDAPAIRLEADLGDFSRNCVERGFLQPELPVASERPIRSTARRTALTLRAWVSLLSTTRALSRLGFAATYRRYAELARPVADEARLDELISHAERAFSRAENFVLIRSAPRDCLPRSLALYRFLLSVGVPAEHCIGVQRFPFEAHAWVECRARVLYESGDYAGSFSELARM